MQKVMLIVVVLAISAACATTGINTKEALAAQKIEVQMDAKGKVTEVEYHILPSQVPAAVREAMDALHPGAKFTGAEKEWNKGKLYYELTRDVQGLKVEAMFTPDGKLHSEEIQVRAVDVPENVKAAGTAAMPGATIRQWEVIRNSSREVVEYHVKMTQSGMAYKVAIGLNGEMLGSWREIPSELEVQR